jgi:hypothetical protein
MGRPKGSRNVPWPAIVAKLREHPGEWLLLPEMAAVPFRTITTIRKRERKALRLDKGVIRCRRKFLRADENRLTVTLILQYDPEGKP